MGQFKEIRERRSSQDEGGAVHLLFIEELVKAVKISRKRPGMTLVELVVTMVVLMVLWFMISGVHYFLIAATMPILREDPDPVLSSVFEHMERNISKGIYWRRYDSGDGQTTDVVIWYPDPTDPNYLDRAMDKRFFYRFYTEEPNSITVSFYPDLPLSVTDAERWTWAGGPNEILLEDARSAYVSEIDGNAKEIYIMLAVRSPFAVYSRDTGMSRTIRMRAMW